MPDGRGGALQQFTRSCNFLSPAKKETPTSIETHATILWPFPSLGPVEIWWSSWEWGKKRGWEFKPRYQRMQFYCHDKTCENIDINNKKRFIISFFVVVIEIIKIDQLLRKSTKATK